MSSIQNAQNTFAFQTLNALTYWQRVGLGAIDVQPVKKIEQKNGFVA